jgi:hypothetical protein
VYRMLRESRLPPEAAGLGLGGGNDPDTSAARAQKMIDDSFGRGYTGTLVVPPPSTSTCPTSSPPRCPCTACW